MGDAFKSDRTRIWIASGAIHDMQNSSDGSAFPPNDAHLDDACHFIVGA